MRNVLQKFSLYWLMILLCCFRTDAFAQQLQQRVSSTMSGKNNKPLPGVNIMVKGTNTGTFTHVEGKYRINVDSEDDILVFSSIGYITQEVEVNGRSVIIGNTPRIGLHHVLWPIDNHVITANTLGTINQNEGYIGAENKVPPLKTIEISY